MNDLIILGTDTDVGKTTFALLWLHRFGEQYAYWKPIESGESDSARIAQLAPAATMHPPAARFQAPLAPPLAARLERAAIPAVRELVRAKPDRAGPLLIETFGSPFSPLNDDELQLAFIRMLG